MTTIFDLRGKGLKLETEDDFNKLVTDLDPTIIEEIHLGGNTIGVGAAKALAAFLTKADKLKIADFADIFTSRLIDEIPVALSAMCDALIDKTSLVEIDLSDNAFGARSAVPMVPFLTKNRSFSILKLNNNGLGPAGGAVIASALLESARLSEKEGKKSNLKTIICGRNRLEDGSALTWAEAFAAHGTLEDVRMPQNGIRQDGIIALAKGLSKNPALERLDLQDNAFNVDDSDEGSRAMANALPLWPGLQQLDFSDCVIASEDDHTPPAIIDALAAGSNPKLHTLQLQNNNIGAESFAMLAESLPQRMPLLKRLELQWNDIDEDDEALNTMTDLLKARGGKLFIDDEEDTEEEELSSEEPEKEAEQEETDELAAMMNKVNINAGP
ncbi:RNI-like protein, partial [Punctularia strigosozonata HHB-11173 SS5]|uniref:RNI-like protein n=1 Tax=Punctularia strigosozonata (strain HHB-11173) TaxID=741275 RepID=UPI0004417471